jgi:hypothetical protein
MLLLLLLLLATWVVVQSLVSLPLPQPSGSESSTAC